MLLPLIYIYPKFYRTYTSSPLSTPPPLSFAAAAHRSAASCLPLSLCSAAVFGCSHLSLLSCPPLLLFLILLTSFWVIGMDGWMDG